MEPRPGVNDCGDGCVAPTAETIASGEYPISRPLFIYVNTGRAAESPALAAFVDSYLSDAGIAAVGQNTVVIYWKYCCVLPGAATPPIQRVARTPRDSLHP